MNPQAGTFWQQILQHTRLRGGSFTKDNEISERVLHDVLAALMSNKKTGPRARQSSNRVQILRRNRNIARTLYHVRLEPSSRKREIFVKVFDHPRKTLEQRLALAEVENRFHQCAQRRFSALPSLGVAPLIGPFPEQPVVVVEKVRGILLSDLLRRAVWKSSFNSADCGVAHTLRRVGEWLRVFHDEPDPIFRPVTLERILESVLREFDRLPASRFNPVLRSKAERFCILSLEQTSVRELRVVPQHSDFLPHNIIVDGDKIYGLDFTSVTADADGVEDVSNFIAYLELFRKLPICSRRAVRRWQASFMDGYGLSSWDGPLLQVFVLRSVFRILHENIRYKGIARSFASRYVASMLSALDGEQENGFSTIGRILP